jgi:hypothetical protein
MGQFEKMFRKIKKIEKIDVLPGDVLVVSLKSEIPDEKQTALLSAMLKGVFKDNKVLVFEPGTNINIMRPNTKKPNNPILKDHGDGKPKGPPNKTLKESEIVNAAPHTGEVVDNES